jgi:AbrB family looped-hinge helix DNA binding protein
MATMVIQMDKAGRVVLPKGVRDQLGLQPGDKLELDVRPEGVELRPTKPGPRIEAVDGLLVLKGVSWIEGGADLVEQDREERLAELTPKRVRKA